MQWNRKILKSFDLQLFVTAWEILAHFYYCSPFQFESKWKLNQKQNATLNDIHLKIELVFNAIVVVQHRIKFTVSTEWSRFTMWFVIYFYHWNDECTFRSCWNAIRIYKTPNQTFNRNKSHGHQNHSSITIYQILYANLFGSCE